MFVFGGTAHTTIHASEEQLPLPYTGFTLVQNIYKGTKATEHSNKNAQLRNLPSECTLPSALGPYRKCPLPLGSSYVT